MLDHENSSHRRQIKVAIITGQLVVGGAEKQLFLWLSHLDRKKYIPIVLTLHPGYGDYWEKPIESLGIQLYRVNNRRTRFFRLMDIIKILSQEKPDLIHAWNLFASPYAGITAKVLGAKSIGSLRTSSSSIKKLSFESVLTRTFIDALLVNSQTAADDLVQIIRKKQLKVFTVRNAVECKKGDRNILRETLSDEYGIPDNIWICSLGRMDPLKRFDLVVKAAHRLTQSYQDFSLILIGDGPERDHLEKFAESLNIKEKIFFTGEIPNASKLLCAMDIFCFTSVYEGLSNVIIEAACAGLPVVTWRLPFYEEILENNKMALMVTPEDVNALTSSIIDLIETPNFRRQLGFEAHKHISSEFSVDKFIKNMSNVYEEILGF